MPKQVRCSISVLQLYINFKAQARLSNIQIVLHSTEIETNKKTQKNVQSNSFI